MNQNENIDDYINVNIQDILRELNQYNKEEIYLNHFSNYINGYHYMTTNEGFKTKETSKIIKKFVCEDFNSVYLNFKQKIDYIIDSIYNKKDQYKKKQKQLKALLEIKTFEQRTPEWYAFRKKILTASDLASAFDKGHFISRDELILSKIDPKPWKGNPATEWGVKYEDVAIAIYEKRNNVKVLEFGLVPHPNIDIFGASPDGIVADTGHKDLTARMLEIKCPWQRKIKHGEVPWHYWAQIQGQLDSCDLDECDFLQVKIAEYKNRHEYLEDKETKEKGLIVATWNVGQEQEGSPKYHYCPIGLTLEEEEKWLDQYFNNETYIIHSVSHWFIAVYSCYTVKRDRAWFTAIIPEIYRFIDDLNFWKEQGKDKLLEYISSKKNKKEVKEKEVKNVDYIETTEIPNVCLL